MGMAGVSPTTRRPELTGEGLIGSGSGGECSGRVSGEAGSSALIGEVVDRCRRECVGGAGDTLLPLMSTDSDGEVWES
jgi:hypothetical protein